MVFVHDDFDVGGVHARVCDHVDALIQYRRDVVFCLQDVRGDGCAEFGRD